MEYVNLSSGDVNNISGFLHNIQSSSNLLQRQFRQKILNDLNDFFGYSSSSFWFINNELDLYDPVFNNIEVDDIVYQKYTEYFYKMDPFYPSNVPSKVLFKRGFDIIRRTDLNSQKNTKNEYAKFLSSTFNLHHETVLMFSNEKGPFASIAIFLPTTKVLDVKDINRLKIISPFINQAISNKLVVDVYGSKSKMFEAILAQSNVGVFTFDDAFKVHYSNTAAKEYCDDFFCKQKKYTSLESFIKKFFINDSNTIWKFGVDKEIFSNTMRRYAMRVIPSVNNDTIMYTVYLQPKSSTENDGYMPNNLTNREKDITLLILNGFTNQEIADKLFISISTVKSHVEHIFSKCHVTNRTSLCSKLKDI